MKNTCRSRSFHISAWVRWLPVLFLLPAFLLSIVSNMSYWQGLSHVETTLRQPQLAEENLLITLENAVSRIREGLEKRFAHGESVQQPLLWTKDTLQQTMQEDMVVPRPMRQYMEELLHILNTSQPLPQEEMSKARTILSSLSTLIKTYRTNNKLKSHDILTAWLTQEQILRNNVAMSLGGSAILTLAALIAIFNRWQLENKLRESQRSQTSLLSNLPGMAYRCRNDEHWTMLFVSQGCESLTGFAPEALIGNRQLAYNDIIDSRDQSRVWQEVQQALAESRPFQLTYRIVTAQGREKWVWEQGSLWDCEDGSEQFLEGFITDITTTITAQEGLKHAKMQAEATYRSRDESILLLSHRLRTPLTSLRGSLGLMANATMDGQWAHYHAMVCNAADQLSYVMEDLLDSAISQHPQSVTTRLFQPHAILKQLVDFSALQAQHEGISMVLELDPTMPSWLRGNVAALRKLLHHLLKHMVHHGGQGEILLTCRPLSTDSGKYSVIFSIFSEGEVADLAHSDNPLLPDHSVPRLVKLLNATFTASHPAAGTHYELVVPLELPTSLPMTSLTRPAPVLPVLNLLLAEDDALLQDVLSEFLERQGHQVSIAANGLEVLEQVERGRFDLILMDLQMPELDGYQAARLLRQSGRGEIAALPIIAITADISERSLTQCLEAGIDAVEGKPIDMAVLAATMASLLGYSAAHCATAPTCRDSEPCVLLEETFLRLLGSLGLVKFQEVGQLMEDNVRELVARLEKAITSQDASDGKAAAHRLAGVAGNLGMEQAAHEAKAVEAAFSQGDLTEAAALLPQLVTGVSKATSLLLQKLAERQ